MYYIRIDKLNGRNDFYNLAKKLYDRGYDDRVEYMAEYKNNSGGCYAHLKFIDENDALAYVLTYGGEVLNYPPTYAIPSGTVRYETR